MNLLFVVLVASKVRHGTAELQVGGFSSLPSRSKTNVHHQGQTKGLHYQVYIFTGQVQRMHCIIDPHPYMPVFARIYLIPYFAPEESPLALHNPVQRFARRFPSQVVPAVAPHDTTSHDTITHMATIEEAEESPNKFKSQYT